MQPKTFILIGRSGSGKGTQAKLLRDHIEKEHSEFPVFYLETGKRFRDFIESSTYTSELAREIQGAGALQPAFLAILMWSNLLVENLTEGEHIIIDGSPRNRVEEALVLDGALRFYKRDKPYFIYLNVSERWARERLVGRGRSDDVRSGFIDTKMQWFKEDVEPAIEYFRDNEGYHFLDINGEQTIDAVHQEIISKL